MFVVQQGLNKTEIDTNMSMGSVLPAPEQFQIQRIIFSFSRSCLDDDIFSIAEGVSFRLILGQKIYARSILIQMHQFSGAVAPFRICDYCRAIYVNDHKCPGCGAPHFSLSTLGDEVATNRQFVMEIDPYIHILSQMQFYVELISAYPISLKSQVRMWCHFEGLHARGVQ